MAKAGKGRPKKEIDFDELDQLCKIQCTQEEVASFFDVTVEVIAARVKEKYDMIFSEYYELKKGFGRVSLRRKQMQLAMSGDKTLLIWLGKQYLGQADKAEVKNSLAINSWDALEKEIAKDKAKD